MANAVFMQRTSTKWTAACMLRNMRPTATIIHAMIAMFSVAMLTAPKAFGATDAPSSNIPAPDAPAQVTTDTPAFCALLSAKMDQESDASFDALALGAQGKELCANGEIRAGIARLRRALLTARDDGYDDEVTIPPVHSSADASAPAEQDPSIVGDDGGGAVVFPPPPAGGGNRGPGAGPQFGAPMMGQFGPAGGGAPRGGGFGH